MKNYLADYQKRKQEFETLHPEAATLDPKQRDKLWKKFFGIPEIRYKCTKCRDGGFVEDGFGKRVLCPNCLGKSWEDQRHEQLKQFSNLPDVDVEQTFENFKRRKGLEEAIAMVTALANGTAGFKLLLLFGPHGVGKTHLSHAAVGRALEKGKVSAFWYVPDFFSAWRTEMAEMGGADQFVHNLATCEFLALDDIGVRAETEAQQAVLEQIVNNRYRYELPLLATTNRDPRDMGDSIMSRFNDAVLSMVVPIVISDFRPLKGTREENID